MRKVLLLLPVLALGLALVAAAGASTHKKKHPVKHKTTVAKTGGTSTKPAAPVFDKRFDCGAALPLSYLDSVYAANSWSDGVTRKDAPQNSRVDNPKDGDNDVSTCSFVHGANGWGGDLTILHGTGAPTFYKRDFATATQVGKNVCKSLAARGQQATDPRQCGPVADTSLGGQAYEYGAYLAVVKGDVFVSFEAGQPLVDGQYMSSPDHMVPSSMLETVVEYVLSRIPKS